VEVAQPDAEVAAGVVPRDAAEEAVVAGPAAGVAPRAALGVLEEALPSEPPWAWVSRQDRVLPSAPR